MDRLSYSTSNIDEIRRFTYWNDVVCRHCVPAASHPLTNKSFDAALTVHRVGAVDISTMSAPHHHWSRGSPHIRQDPEDDLWLAYMAQGSGRVEQSARQTKLDSGDIVLYDSSRPFTFSLQANSIHLLRLPRRSLLQRCPGAERLSGQGFEAGQVGASPLKSLIEYSVATDFSKMRSGAASQFGSTLLDLVALMLEVRMGKDATPHEYDLYARISSYIEQHFGDPTLSLESLAEVHHVSSRTVTRAFARRDQTPMTFVWKLRLQASRLALTEGRSRSVTEAAFEHGFSDVSHFSRAFRKSFGCTPQSLLIRH